MAVALRAASNGKTDSGTSLAISQPSGLKEGDLLLLWAIGQYYGPAYDIDIPAGWTSLGKVTSSIYLNAELAYRLATPGDVSSWSHSITQPTAGGILYVCMAFTGVDSDAPIVGSDVYNAGNTSNVSRNLPSAVTPNTNEIVVLTGGSGSASANFSSWACSASNPSSWTEVSDDRTDDSACGAAYGTPSGTTDISSYSYTASQSDYSICGFAVLKDGPAEVVDDLDGSHRLMEWSAEDDLDGSHRLLEYADDDLDGSHKLLGWLNDDLDGSHRLMVWAVADDLDGSHRLMVWAVADDLDGSHIVCGVDDLEGSARILVWADDDLEGSARILVWNDDDLDGVHFIEVAGAPAAKPQLLYTPQLSLVVGDTTRVDLVAEGADRESIRFGNHVIGGHGGASIEIPKRPAERVVNELRRGQDARLYDAGHLLWQGVVKKVSGEDTGGGKSMMRVEFYGPMDLADLDESFRWTWVDADYSAWQQLETPAVPYWQWSRDAYYSEYWFNVQRVQDCPWDVRTDGELYLGTQRGYTYLGNAWYNVAGRSPIPRARVGARIDRLLGDWPSGSRDRLAGIKAIQFDYRANTGTRFRARVLRAPNLWCDVRSEAAVFSQTGSGATSGDDEQVSLADDGAVIVELEHYSSGDTVAAGEFFQLLRVRLLVRPDGPGTRSWSVGDALPRLDQCLSDIMLDGDGVLATSVDAEQIGDPLEHARADGPTRSEAAAQIAQLDEDADGTGQPIEYGIWDERRGIIRRRPAAPDDDRCWLAIDTSRDDVSVSVEYDDTDAPDYVEVRYQYLYTQLLRHSSAAIPGAWAARGYADDRPYDWQFTETGSGKIENVLEDGQRRWKLSVGAAAGEARMTHPKAGGTYPVTAGSSADRIPYMGDIPLRAAVWARCESAGYGYGVMNYFLNGASRGSDTLWQSTSGLKFDDAVWQRYVFDFRPEPSSAPNEMTFSMHMSVEGSLYWRNACLYPLIPEGTELSAWYPSEPTTAGASVKTIDLGLATMWQGRNAAFRFWRSFRRGAGKGTIDAKGVLYDVRGREVPVSRVRGGWWASIVNDPRCTSPLYISSVEGNPELLDMTLAIGGEPMPWSDRRRPAERQRFGTWGDWRTHAMLARRSR